MSRELDAIDRKILDELQLDGRLSIVELANRVHLTKTPCTERVRRLEKAGVLDGYHAILDPGKVGMSHVTVVHVNLMRTVLWLHVAIGLMMLGIDLTTPMPWYWTAVEGIPVALAGLAILWLYRLAHSAVSGPK